MLARSFALAVLVWLCGSPAGWAGETAGATIVLQLPPSMSPDAVKDLLADLVAKGAKPTVAPADPPADAPRPSLTSADFAAQVWGATKEALGQVPILLRTPRAWLERAEAEGATGEAALEFWLIALIGLIAAPLIGKAGRSLGDRWQPVVSAPGLLPRLKSGIIRLLFAVFSLAIFSALYWCALLSLSSGQPIVEETADRLVWGALVWRLSIIALTIVLSPSRPDLRLLAIDDDGARFCFRWLAVYLTANPVNIFIVWLVERLGFTQQAVFGAALAMGFVITAYKVVMFWVIRRPIGRAILAVTNDEPGPMRRAAASSWHWLFIALSVGIFVAAGIEFALGRGAWVARASAATQGIAVALAVLWQIGQNLIARIFGQETGEIRSGLRRERFQRALQRLSNAFLLILGIAWLGETWGLDLVDPAPGSFERLLLRPVLGAAATILAAWILWTALSAIIDEKMPAAVAPGDEDAAIRGSTSRLGTLLPLVRNLALIGLAVMALVLSLFTLGLDIGPLLAGLGVIGLAIGFGAQTLVRDVISGLFFLMEDAFRVGEYIDTGRLRGTVEGMSLRSVRLRHQNGQVHTVPFGQVLAVTNFSRDWSVIKFNLQLEPTSDIDKVRKTIKRVGEELLDDPEIGSEFIQPLKMQGVVDALQTALIVRCKFTATPIRPTYLHRRALHGLIEAFGIAEIHFAAPNVIMQLAGAAAG